MEMTGATVGRSLLKCVCAVVECAGVVCRCLAKVLEMAAAKLRGVLDDGEHRVAMPREAGSRERLHRVNQPGTVETEPESFQAELIVRSRKQENDPDEGQMSTVIRARQTAGRLTAWGRYYAVASGVRPGVYPTWFAAGNQVLNVSGAMQERFGSRLEALQYIAAYFHAIGNKDEIVEYDEFEAEVWRYQLSDVPRHE